MNDLYKTHLKKLESIFSRVEAQRSTADTIYCRVTRAPEPEEKEPTLADEIFSRTQAQREAGIKIANRFKT